MNPHGTHVGIEKNFEPMYQIVLGMSNQFLATHLSRIVRCRALVGSQKVADRRLPRVPPTGDYPVGQAALSLRDTKARSDHEGIFGKIRLATR